MKKILASYIIFAVAFWLVAPALAGANTTGPISTSLHKQAGAGDPPVVKAKWEMKGPCFSGSTYDQCGDIGEGKDDSTAPGAQFDAPGVWGENMNYTVCAIVTDPNGADDIYGVYADIYWPEGRAVHAPDPDNDRDDQDTGDNTTGCGQFIEQNTLHKLSKEDGYHLFCEVIQENNYNLPEYGSIFGSLSDMYAEICAPDGELMKETAFVYCDDKSITWEDPAGDYRVDVNALDKSGLASDVLTNYFEYLSLTKYEVDFTSVDYDNVLLNTHKKISGDKTFQQGDGKPTVRNLGNTRLLMGVAQDDMGLGKSSGDWNVRYDARVGNYELDWKNYFPFKMKDEPGEPTSYTYVNEILDLSETEEMDFSILIYKWPNTNDDYYGSMWLTAKYTGFRHCGS